jgi:MFS family permease
MLISTSVVMAVTAMPAGWLSDRVGQRLPATIGMLITVAGIFSLRALHAKAEPMSVVLHLAIIGLGIGLFTSPNNSAIMGSAPRSRQGVAGALLAAARNLGFAMGVAFTGLIYQSRMSALAGYPLSESITTAMHDATTIVAVVALFGVLASALRGKVPLHTEE